MNGLGMNLPDGPGWSPDGGKYWVKDGVTYWHDGQTTPNNAGIFFRVMPGGYEHDENYAAWTPEHRAAVFAESKARYAVAEERERKEEVRISELRESARKKLTVEEAEACELYPQ